MRISAVVAIVLLLSGCRQAAVNDGSKEDSKDAPLRRYALHGEVLRLDPKGKIAAIKHQKIGDWMEAMTMEFPVKDQAEFDRLRAGETINGTVFVQGNSYWVGEIQEDAPQQNVK
jgi:Cu/Ag efflux protein CusF